MDYEHDEIEGDEGVVGTSFFNETLDARFEWIQKRKGDLSGSFGLQFISKDQEAIGEELLDLRVVEVAARREGLAPVLAARIAGRLFGVARPRRPDADQLDELGLVAIEELVIPRVNTVEVAGLIAPTTRRELTQAPVAQVGAQPHGEGGEQPQGGDWTKLNTNENPFGPSPKANHIINIQKCDQ